MTVCRIVTTSTSPTLVGPRVSQWAYSLQPWTATGVNVQVRAENGTTRVEAVDVETGELFASGRNIVDVMNVMAGKRTIARAA